MIGIWPLKATLGKSLKQSTDLLHGTTWDCSLLLINNSYWKNNKMRKDGGHEKNTSKQQKPCNNSNNNKNTFPWDKNAASIPNQFEVHNSSHILSTKVRAFYEFFSKAFVCNFTKSNTPLWVFSHFSNCTNGIKSRKVPQIMKMLQHWNYYLEEEILHGGTFFIR